MYDEAIKIDPCMFILITKVQAFNIMEIKLKFSYPIVSQMILCIKWIPFGYYLLNKFDYYN